MSASYKDKKLQQLAAQEKRLIAEENWLIAAINDIKTQKIAIEIEILQLSSMLKTPKNESVKHELREQTHNQFMILESQVNSNRNKLELLDQAESSANTMQLDLTFGDNITNSANGMNFPDAEDSEMDDDDDYTNS